MPAALSAAAAPGESAERAASAELVTTASAERASGFCYRASVAEAAGAMQAAGGVPGANGSASTAKEAGAIGDHHRSRLAFRAQLARHLRCDTVCWRGGRVTRCGRGGQGSVSAALLVRLARRVAEEDASAEGAMEAVGTAATAQDVGAADAADTAQYTVGTE